MLQGNCNRDDGIKCLLEGDFSFLWEQREEENT